MRERFTGLWRHPDFLKLWAGQTVSLFGSQITLLALPFVAVLALDASPAQMGLLRVFQTAPALLLGLFIGAWIDRARRRPILLWADLGRALSLGAIPLVAAFGLLRMEVVYVIGFLIGVLTVCFDLAYLSFLPALVRREQLVEGNSKLEVSFSVASIAGPGLAGALVQIVTAPFAILLDAVSFLISALFLSLIRTVEPPPSPRDRRQCIRADIGEGLRVVVGNATLRALALTPAVINLSLGIQATIFLLFVTRELRLTPALVGVVLAAAGPGFLLGALLTERLGRQFGVGRILIGGAVVFSLTRLALPLAGGPLAVVVPLLAGANLLGGITGQINAINSVSLRQAITPDRLLGRVNASIRFIAWSIAPLGGLLGGLLGERISLRGILGVATALAFALPVVFWYSPLRTLRELPEHGEQPATTPMA